MHVTAHTVFSFQRQGAMEMESNRMYILHRVGDLEVLQLSRSAILPTMQPAHPASYTLYTPRDFVVLAGRTTSLSTDLCVGRIKDHSSTPGPIFKFAFFFRLVI